MNIVSILTIIISVSAINLPFFIYLLNRMDSNFKTLQKEIQDVRHEIQGVKDDVLWIKFQHGHIPEEIKEESKKN